MVTSTSPPSMLPDTSATRNRKRTARPAGSGSSATQPATLMSSMEWYSDNGAAPSGSKATPLAAPTRAATMRMAGR